MEELSYVFTQYFVSCFHVRFYFSLPLIFTLLATPCWPLAFPIFLPSLWISVFFSLRNSSPLFSKTRSSSFSVVHVSVNIQNNAEKTRLCCCCCFFPKSPGGHLISFQIKLWEDAFGLLRAARGAPLLTFLRQCVDVIQSVLSPSRFRLLRVVIGESFKCFCPTLGGWPKRESGGMDLAWMHHVKRVRFRIWQPRYKLW